jgi:hypothetical protein
MTEDIMAARRGTRTAPPVEEPIEELEELDDEIEELELDDAAELEPEPAPARGRKTTVKKAPAKKTAPAKATRKAPAPVEE